MINLISDTFTKPCKGMIDAMSRAEVGDDVFREDPSVNKLQDKLAEMFGKEAGLFCPSGTMSNQIAIKCHTQAMDEVICDVNSHIYQYENGGYAFNSGVSISLIQGKEGIITKDQIEAVLKPDFDWLPKSKLIVLENSANRAGGGFYSLEQIKPIRNLCIDKGLSLHLDGARLFNVLVETQENPKDIGELFDSISICLSKGLGAPVGTVLLGSKLFINQARRWRKAWGGGMRQSGFLAAAGIYAIENNIERLKFDNDRAKRLGLALSSCAYVKYVRPVKTNIVIFDVVEHTNAAEVLSYYRSKGLLASSFASHTIRFVTHLDVNDEMIDQAIQIIQSFKNN